MTSSEELRKVEYGLQKAIQLLLETMKFYGKEDWRVLSMIDRGETAKRVYKEITGKYVWED